MIDVEKREDVTVGDHLFGWVLRSQFGQRRAGGLFRSIIHSLQLIILIYSCERSEEVGEVDGVHPDASDGAFVSPEMLPLSVREL